MSRLLLIAAFLVAIPVVSTIAGAVYYGWLGGFAGFGLSLVILKICGKLAKLKFSRAFEKQMAQMEESAKLMEAASIEIGALTDAPRGDLLEGDEELGTYYPRHYYLQVAVNPNHDQEWEVAAMHLQVNYDEDLLDDYQDPEELGLGLYLYSVERQDSGEFIPVTPAEKLTGSQNLRFHFGAGKQLEDVAIFYHMKSLTEYKLESSSE